MQQILNKPKAKAKHKAKPNIKITKEPVEAIRKHEEEPIVQVEPEQLKRNR